MLKACAVLSTLLALTLSALPAQADDALVDRWYRALLSVDRDALSSLLSDDAVIRLTDLGIDQSKSEFIASMDEWEMAVRGATIRHRILGTQGAVTTVLSCYDFPANDLLMRETFTLSGDLIVGNSQETVAETCDGF
jgi:hypothetical protein